MCTILKTVSLSGKSREFVFGGHHGTNTQFLLFQTRVNNFLLFPLFPQRFSLSIMENHILSGRFPLNNMNNDLSLTTLAGTKLHIKKLTNVRCRIHNS